MEEKRTTLISQTLSICLTDCCIFTVIVPLTMYLQYNPPSSLLRKESYFFSA